MSKTVTVRAQQKWDYCSETRKSENAIVNAINERGQQAWELVNVLYYKDAKGDMAWTAFMKRPSVSQPQTPVQNSMPTAKALPEESAKNVPQPKGFDLEGDEFQLKTE